VRAALYVARWITVHLVLARVVPYREVR
jgi:hypothetical protein